MTDAVANLTWQGRRDPVGDVAPATLGPMGAAVYPDGWTIDRVGTRLEVKPAEPDETARPASAASAPRTMATRSSR